MNRKVFLYPLVPAILMLGFSVPVWADLLVFPQAAVGPAEGGSLVIELRLGNRSPVEEWQGEILLLNNADLSPMTGLTVTANGENLGTPTGSTGIALGPSESVIYRITSETLQTGVLVLKSDESGSVDNVVSSFAYLLQGNAGPVVDVIAVQGSREARTGFRLIGSSLPTFDTGVAVVAQQSVAAAVEAESDGASAAAVATEPVEVQVLARLRNGEQHAGSFALGGGEAQQRALFPYAVIPELPRDAEVVQFLISCDEPIFVTTLLVGAPPAFNTVQIGAAPAEPDLDSVPFTGLNVDTQDRDAVVEFYRNFYLASEGFIADWTGDEESCQPGSVSDAFNRALLRRINYFRAMAGAPGDLTLDSDLNARAQAVALMMVANNRADHEPEPSWVCFTETGQQAASKSILFYLRNLTPSVSTIVDGFIRDAGSGNSSVGHRRWLLYPRQRVIGAGTAVTEQDAASALRVIGDFASGPIVTTSWPPAGYVPYSLVFERWSYSYPGADFSNALVTMERDSGIPVEVTVEPVAEGFGDNSIVWVPEEFLPDSTYHVTIGAVRVNGIPREFSYTVHPIDPQD